MKKTHYTLWLSLLMSLAFTTYADELVARPIHNENVVLEEDDDDFEATVEQCNENNKNCETLILVDCTITPEAPGCPPASENSQ